MAKSTRKELREKLKSEYLEKVIESFSEEEILRVGSNEIAIPVVDSEGNEDYIVIVVKIPTGSRLDGEPYDGYAVAEDYAMKQEEKARKAEERKAKAEKDKAKREAEKAKKESVE